MNKVYTKIESIVGDVITVRAQGVRYNDLAVVGKSFANVIKLDGRWIRFWQLWWL